MPRLRHYHIIDMSECDAKGSALPLQEVSTTDMAELLRWGHFRLQDMRQMLAQRRNFQGTYACLAIGGLQV